MKKILNKKMFLGVILIIVISLILFFFLYKSKNESKQDSQIEQNTIVYNSEFKANKAKTENIIFPAYTRDLYIERDQDIMPILLVNPSANKNIYFQYKLSIIENKKIDIGQTKLIKYGEAIKNLKINKKSLKNLLPETYKCRISVSAFNYNQKTKKKIKLNNAHWDIKLHLEK